MRNENMIDNINDMSLLRKKIKNYFIDDIDSFDKVLLSINDLNYLVNNIFDNDSYNTIRNTKKIRR